MTHATKAVYKLLLSDYVKVSKVSAEDMLFDEQDILRSMDKIEVTILFVFIFDYVCSKVSYFSFSFARFEVSSSFACYLFYPEIFFMPF